jgi:hypothetical protein
VSRANGTLLALAMTRELMRKRASAAIRSTPWDSKATVGADQPMAMSHTEGIDSTCWLCVTAIGLVTFSLPGVDIPHKVGSLDGQCSSILGTGFENR